MLALKTPGQVDVMPKGDEANLTRFEISKGLLTLPERAAPGANFSQFQE